MISDEHQSGVNPLILRRFLDFFNGEKPPPGAAPKAGVGGSNPFRDAKNFAESLDLSGFSAFLVFTHLTENLHSIFTITILTFKNFLLIGIEHFFAVC